MKNQKKFCAIKNSMLFILLLAMGKNCFGEVYHPPIISIEAGRDATAPGPNGCPGEDGAQTGTFIISVDPPFTNDITVYITRIGSAFGPAYAPENGCYEEHFDYRVDYPLPDWCITNDAFGGREHIVIPAGTASVTLKVIPLFVLDCKTNETVSMTISASAPGYVVEPIQATIQLFATDTLGAYDLCAMPNIVMEGESTQVGCARGCACATPRPLSAFQVDKTFELLGSAKYGIDYVINPNPNICVDASHCIPTVTMHLWPSNDWASFSLTTFSNTSYGDKVIVFIPFCDLTKCYTGPPAWFTNNQGCVYEDGVGNSILTIMHPTIQPTLDTAAYNAPVFSFNINGQSDAPYMISTSTNLVDWTDIGTVTMTSSTMRASDLLAGNFTQHFYRVALETNGVAIINTNLVFQETTRTQQISNNSIYSPADEQMATQSNMAAGAFNATVSANPEEQMLLIETQRQIYEEEGSPLAKLLPPTPLTPLFEENLQK